MDMYVWDKDVHIEDLPEAAVAASRVRHSALGGGAAEAAHVGLLNELEQSNTLIHHPVGS